MQAQPPSSGFTTAPIIPIKDFPSAFTPAASQKTKSTQLRFPYEVPAF